MSTSTSFPFLSFTFSGFPSPVSPSLGRSLGEKFEKFPSLGWRFSTIPFILFPLLTLLTKGKKVLEKAIEKIPEKIPKNTVPFPKKSPLPKKDPKKNWEEEKIRRENKYPSSLADKYRQEKPSNPNPNKQSEVSEVKKKIPKIRDQDLASKNKWIDGFQWTNRNDPEIQGKRLALKVSQTNKEGEDFLRNSGINVFHISIVHVKEDKFIGGSHFTSGPYPGALFLGKYGYVVGRSPIILPDPEEVKQALGSLVPGEKMPRFSYTIKKDQTRYLQDPDVEKKLNSYLRGVAKGKEGSPWPRKKEDKDDE